MTNRTKRVPQVKQELSYLPNLFCEFQDSRYYDWTCYEINQNLSNMHLMRFTYVYYQYLSLLTKLTKVGNSNAVHLEVYSMQHYVIKFVCDFRQVFMKGNMYQYKRPTRGKINIYSSPRELFLNFYVEEINMIYIMIIIYYQTNQ